jgi:hypothetical protein
LPRITSTIATHTKNYTTPETGDRFQMFSVSCPAGYNPFYVKESELAARYKIVTKNRARNWWKEEERKFRWSSKKPFIF